MAGQTYSPYRRAGRQVARPAGFGRAASPRRSALSQALLAAEADAPAPARRSLSGGGFLSGKASLSGLADPAARRWVVLGTLGIVSSLLLTVAVALLSNRGVASADVPVVEPVRTNRVTLVREIGGVPKSSPTPGTGVTASAPAAPGSATALDTSMPQAVASNALRQLRRVGRAIVTAEGIRRLALGGAVPFSDGGTVTAAAPADEPRQVALADADSDPDVTLDAGSVFLRLADDFLKRVDQADSQGVVALASPAVVTATTTTRPAQATVTVVPPTATSVPPTATSVPATATSVPPTATSVPATPTSVPATATTVPATAAPATATSVPATSAPATATPIVVIVHTATPLPATQTPIVVTATPEPTRRATRTPTPEVIVVTATPSSAASLFPNSVLPNLAAGVLPPWMQQAAPTNTPQPAVAMVPPTPAPTNTLIPTGTPYIIPDVRTAPPVAQPAPPTSTPQRRADSAPTLEPIPPGPAPILAESGTPTPVNPTPRATPRQGAPDKQQQPGQPNGAVAQGQQPDASREPSALERLTVRALIAVNAARAQAGALPLSRNSAMDTASAMHAQYDVATGQAEGNFQTRGTPLFLGETPSSRVARAAGSTRSPAVERVAEVMALGETEPERAVQGWLDSVYHRVLILDLAAQYGGYGQQTTGSSTTAVLDLGGKREVANASGWFPASGATEVPTRCVCDDYAEATGKPGPFGYPVTLLLGQVRPQGLPTLARLAENDENGPGVVAELIDAYGNPTLLPQTPLKPNTRYVVTLAWANGPTVTWGFTTGGQ